MILTPLRSLQFSQLCRLGAIFLVSIILARIVRDKSIIAEYEKLILIGGSFTFFWISGLTNVFVPFYHTVHNDKKPQIIFHIFLLLSVLSILATFLIFLLRDTLYTGEASLFYYYLAFLLFNSPSLLVEYIFLVRSNSIALAFFGAMISLVYLLSFFIPLYLGYPLSTSFLCLLGVALIRYLILLIIILKNFKPSINKKLLTEIIQKALPTIGGLLLGGSMVYVDSYMADYFFSKSQFAIYQYGARELPFVLLFASSLSSYASGNIAKSVQDNNLISQLTYIKNSSSKLMHVFFPVTILLLVFSNQLFLTFYGSGFLESVPVFRIYLLLIISRLIFPQTILLGLHKNKYLFQASTLEVIVNFSLNLLFIYYFGLIGIAISTVIAYLIEKIYHAWALYKQGISPRDYIPIKTWLIYSVICLLIFVLVNTISI